MTMLEASDGEQRSYLELAEVIETTSDQTTAELHQLWRRIVFSVLISNTDDHLRHHGFLHHRGDVWRAAPAFDLNPNPEPGATFLSTSTDGGDDAACVGTALAVAEYFGLTGDQARHILADVAAAVGQWRSVAAGHQLCAAEIRAMEPAFVALHETVEV